MDVPSIRVLKMPWLFLIVDIDEVRDVRSIVYDLQHGRPDLDHGKTRTKKPPI